jgi:diguanylate cyclase (GGDEF)-like protein
MTIAALGRWARALWRRRLVIQGASLLLLGMSLAALIAYQYAIFAPASTAIRSKKGIDLGEALVLIALLCIGLLVFSWRMVLSQRREVTRRIAAERLARELAHQDSLTGLANRRQFDKELQAAIEAPTRIGGTHAVLLLDLNGFKRVNDVYGHGAGDEVLIHVAMRLRGAVRDGDLVARLGGDEFVILARQLAGAEQATSIALRVIRDLDQPIAIGKIKHRVGIAIGIALIPKDGLVAGDIMREADLALYRAKAETGSALRFFERAMDDS